MAEGAWPGKDGTIDEKTLFDWIGKARSLAALGPGTSCEDSPIRNRRFRRSPRPRARERACSDPIEQSLFVDCPVLPLARHLPPFHKKSISILWRALFLPSDGSSASSWFFGRKISQDLDEEISLIPKHFVKSNGRRRVAVKEPQINPFEVRQPLHVHAGRLPFHCLLQFLEEEMNVVPIAHESVKDLARSPRPQSSPATHP